ncbi:bifunctional phosphopantothenoylcysteine decarboxylase/phosphopantothenate--cysteine ligase CoaBC [bacterium]|nr:bifunctional phosphopantothenoylcysteine decarboxylase/phosphopantothenate--cysteine ligase CoaBC [bacterium]
MKVELGITGGIAAYKTPTLVRLLKTNGFDVHCSLSTSAIRFVTPETLAVVSENPVNGPGPDQAHKIRHLDARQSADVFIVAPATANFIAKASHGICDSPLLSSFLAFPGRKILVPAMHDTMWENPATSENIRRLKSWGVEIIGPSTGPLASGDFGPGRMIDLELIVHKLNLLKFDCPKLDGINILIGLGGTSEPIDPVRYITNRSTGKFGSTLAHTFSLQGATVTAVSTIDLINNPHISQVIRVETSDQMRDAITTHWPENDVLVMPAAVSDFRPKQLRQEKIKRSHSITMDFEPTIDILGSLHKRESQVMIGFCLDDEDRLMSSAEDKLNRKKLDAVIANTATQFGKDQRTFTIVTPEGSQAFSKATLPAAASEISGLITRLVGRSQAL